MAIKIIDGDLQVGKVVSTYSSLATVESSSTASKAYAVDDLLIYNGTLYKVTSAISQGDTIIPETNVIATTIEALLNDNTDKWDSVVTNTNKSTTKAKTSVIPSLWTISLSIDNLVYPLNKSANWIQKTWTGLTSFFGRSVWTDGENLYYSNATSQYVLDKSTSTWTEKTWIGLTNFGGTHVWTDGNNMYYSNGIHQYILNKATSTWTVKTWTGLTDPNGQLIWTDGSNIYCSNSSSQYILDKTTSTWTQKTWTGLTNFSGYYVWTDGENIYYSTGTSQYVLNKDTSTWTQKTWLGLTSFGGQYVWTDGENIYYSVTSNQWILDKSTSTWTNFYWSGLSRPDGEHVWTDGRNIYQSSGTSQYILNKKNLNLGVKLNTNNSNMLTVSNNEEINYTETINLHKISKTGNYYDLLNKPISDTSMVQRRIFGDDRICVCKVMSSDSEEIRSNGLLVYTSEDADEDYVANSYRYNDLTNNSSYEIWNIQGEDGLIIKKDDLTIGNDWFYEDNGCFDFKYGIYDSNNYLVGVAIIRMIADEDNYRRSWTQKAELYWHNGPIGNYGHGKKIANYEITFKHIYLGGSVDDGEYQGYIAIPVPDNIIYTFEDGTISVFEAYSSENYTDGFYDHISLIEIIRTVGTYIGGE